MSLQSHINLLAACGLLMASAGAAPAQVWVERGDAGDFPQRSAQRTLDVGPLSTIVGSTATAATDGRDGFCLRIPDPARFLATTDPRLSPAAGAEFDSRLLLYANRICPGDAVGRFSFSGCLAFGPTGTRGRAIAVGHLDDDGNLDVVVTNQSSDAIACLGDGAFGFACSEVGAGTNQGRGVALGHLNADDDVDLVLAYQDPPQRACLGDGAGGFACSDLPDVEAARSVALGDFNEDDDLDVVLTGQNTDRICLGGGDGTFAGCTSVHEDLSSGTSVAAGFLDGDTHLDLAFARAPISEGRTCLGDGAGTFTCSTFDDPGFTQNMSEVALADFDNDGVLDAALSFNPDDDFLCFGDGAGSFGDCVAFAAHNYEAQGLAVGGLAPASVGWDDFETGDLRAWATPDL